MVMQINKAQNENLYSAHSIHQVNEKEEAANCTGLFRRCTSFSGAKCISFFAAVVDFLRIFNLVPHRICTYTRENKISNKKSHTTITLKLSAIILLKEKFKITLHQQHNFTLFWEVEVERETVLDSCRLLNLSFVHCFLLLFWLLGGGLVCVCRTAVWAERRLQVARRKKKKLLL